MRLRPIDNLGVGREPDTPFALRVPNELVEYPDARTVPNDMRMAGELEDAAIVPGRIELAAENVEHVRGCCVGSERGGAVHHEIDRIVAYPLHWELDDPRRFSVEKQFVAVFVCHKGRVIREPELLLDAQRVGTEIPGRGPEPDGALAGNLLERVRRAQHQLALRLKRQHRVEFVNPAVDADLMALADDAPLLVRVEQRRDSRHVERCLDPMAIEKLQNSRYAYAVAVLAP